MELSKSDKKNARDLIRKGMMVQFERGLHRADAILNDWKQGKGNHQEAYHALYKHIVDFDKGIAARYDNMPNHSLLFVLVQQVQEGLVPRQELAVFPEEVQTWMKQFS